MQSRFIWLQISSASLISSYVQTSAPTTDPIGSLHKGKYFATLFPFKAMANDTGYTIVYDTGTTPSRKFAQPTSHSPIYPCYTLDIVSSQLKSSGFAEIRIT